MKPVEDNIFITIKRIKLDVEKALREKIYFVGMIEKLFDVNGLTVTDRIWFDMTKKGIENYEKNGI